MLLPICLCYDKFKFTSRFTSSMQYHDHVVQLPFINHLVAYNMQGDVRESIVS